MHGRYGCGVTRTVLSTKHLFAALAEHPDRPSASTVKRWVEGKQEIPSWALDEVARLLGIKRDAAPEGAAETLLKLWTGDQPPAWSNLQVEKIIEAIRADRAETLTAEADQIAEAVGASLAVLLPRLLAQASRADDDQ